MQDIDRIKEITGTKESECSCSTCVNMCKTAPCIGTPNEIKRIVDHGFAHKLQPTIWLAGVTFKLIPYPVPMIASRVMENGHCAFLKNNLCTLHDLGLKPTEGKIAHCTRGNDGAVLKEVAKTWLDPNNSKTIDLIVKALVAYEKPKERNQTIYL